MRRMRPALLCLIAINLLCGLGPAAGQLPTAKYDELEKVALEEMSQLGVPGAAVGIVSGDRLIYAKGLGISDVETARPLTADMLFRLGSTTKMFTATALVTLAEEGKIKLDQPIGRAVKGLHPAIAAVTAYQLLTHTSGILDEAPMYGSQDDSALGLEIKSWKNDRFFTVPGDIYSYSNPAYWLAGYVVEHLSGKPYADAMNDKVFAPLGMAHTSLRPTMAMTYPLAQGHDAGAGRAPAVVRPAANNAASWPAGSIFSNVNDLSRFVIAFLNGGKIDGKQVLPPAVIARLSTPYVETPGTLPARYGYGLTVREERGVRMLMHAGSRSGYGSLIWMAPDQGVGMIILANRTGASLNRTAEKAMEMFLPLAPKAAETEVEWPFTAGDKADWPGMYTQPPSQKLEILLKGDKLFLKRGNTELPLRKTGVNQMATVPPGGGRGQQYLIVRGMKGKNLYLHSGGRSFKKSRTSGRS